MGGDWVKVLRGQEGGKFSIWGTVKWWNKNENIGHEETNEIFLLWPWRVCFMKEPVNSKQEMLKWYSLTVELVRFQ